MRRDSLQQAIDKWFSPAQRGRLSVKRFRCDGAPGHRGVTVRLFVTSDAIELLFFRHGDGTWRIFPPDAARPTMNAATWAAL